MYPINHYIPLAIACKAKEAQIKGKVYDPTRDNGLIGSAFELSVKDFYGKPLTLSPAGTCDLRIGSRHAEVKQGAGELGRTFNKTLLKGSGLVLYVPVVVETATLDRQQGYVMDKAVFLEALSEAGAIRTKEGVKITIQTFWIKSANKPHGRLLDRMLDAFESRVESGEALTLEGFLKG